MTTYTDLFVVPVPKKNIEAYRKQAEQFVAVWRDHGALACVEVEAEDAPLGKVTLFPQSVDLQPDENVFVGIITYRSRAHRDEVSAKAMKDPRMASMNSKSMPFDGKRMFWGGFKPFVGEAAAAMPAIQPYLFFRGRCEEAIEYYKQTLNAEVGNVQMPLGKAFFSPRFGAVADKFGVSWMVIVTPPA